MRWIKRLGLSALALLLIVMLTVAWWLRSSLPVIDGEVAVAGINARATIERDTNGSVTIIANSRNDAAFASGYAHGQDRFFQMDLSRRYAAGELAGLFGERALNTDKRQRVYQMRKRAGRAIAALPDDYRAFLQSYVNGVNAGLASLSATPFEYGLLRSEPAQWALADSVLVLAGMYFQLQGGDASDVMRLGGLHACFNPVVANFLSPIGTQWDTPVDAEHGWPVPEIPGKQWLNLRDKSPWQAAEFTLWHAIEEEQRAIGSNNWAVGGEKTADGSALIADDMHLGLSMPHIWYRMRLLTHGSNGETLNVTGVSLPGMPFIVVGSNTHIAWGFTNSYGDWINLIQLETDSTDEQYLTDDGHIPFDTDTEIIQVKNAEPVTLKVQKTRWGPVIDDDYLGAPVALQWVALSDQLFTAPGFLELETAHDVNAAVTAAAAMSIPAQNLLVGDTQGNIGWTIMGRIPRRYAAASERLPIRWTEADSVWNGWLSAAEYPAVINPDDGLLYTANSRVVSDELLSKVGFGSFALGARSRQIQQRLQALQSPIGTEDMHRIHTDTEALFMQRWRMLLLELIDSQLSAGAADTRYAAVKTLLETGGSHADTGSVAYRLIREFRERVRVVVFGSIMQHCQNDSIADEMSGFRGTSQMPGPLWRLVTEQPLNWLDAGYPHWNALLITQMDQLLDSIDDLQTYTWGQRNVLDMTHPLGSIPVIGKWLNMPKTALAGDRYMPKVAGPEFGQSQRMAVTPGREEKGYMVMPGGQSGHPLSPFYDVLHNDWLEGRQTPFLPGPAVHTLTLQPDNN